MFFFSFASDDDTTFPDYWSLRHQLCQSLTSELSVSTLLVLPRHQVLTSDFKITDDVGFKNLEMDSLIILPCYPVQSWIKRSIGLRVEEGWRGLFYRKLEPRYPLQEIPVGNCILLLCVLGVFIFLMGIICHRIHSISRVFEFNIALNCNSDWSRSSLT